MFDYQQNRNIFQFRYGKINDRTIKETQRIRR